MKSNNHITTQYDRDHVHFGGRIYLSDFDTTNRHKHNPNGSTIAARIASDLHFEQQCLRTKAHQL